MFLIERNAVGFVVEKTIGNKIANFVHQSPLVNPRVQGEEMVKAVEVELPLQHRQVPLLWVEKPVQLRR